MTVVGVASVRSCGVTTMAAGLAMVWPGQVRRVLVEADPAGGTLAAVAGLGAEPGLVSLAAAARRHSDPELVFEHAQTLADGAAVVCAPPGAEQTRSALVMLGQLFDRLGELDAPVVVDCGRLDPGGLGIRLFEGAGLRVLACRPQLADLNALAALLGATESRPRPLAVLVGPGPYPANEISGTLGIEVARVLPWDPDAAAVLGGMAASSRQITRSPLVRGLRSLADDLAARVAKLTCDRPLPAVAAPPAELAEVAP